MSGSPSGGENTASNPANEPDSVPVDGIDSPEPEPDFDPGSDAGVADAGADAGVVDAGQPAVAE